MPRSLLLLALVAVPVFADDLAELDKPAPSFRLPVYNQRSYGEPTAGLDSFVGADSADKKTKVLVVSFMASWCAPCKKEMPYLQKLYDENKDKGLRVMMIAIDTEAEGQKKVDELIELNKVTFPVGKDRFNIVARRWLGTQSPLPSLFFVKPDGTVSSVHRGYSSDGAEVLATELEKVLGVKVSKPVVVAVTPAPEPVPEPAPVVVPKGKTPKKKK
ncbi:MAG: TlpA family protein disulfide reductase [Archangium sp.]